MQEQNQKNYNASKQEDYHAIRRVLDGDNAAFEILQKKYSKLIAALIRRMVKNEDDVDDLTQETFIKAYKALEKFQFGFSFSAWIYRIASNTCIDFLRKKRFTIISLTKQTPGETDEEEMEIEDDSYLPDVTVMNDERRTAIRDAISNLPENYRRIIILRHEKELDYKEISEMLDIPLGTVKAHLFRARKILYTALKNQESLFQSD